MALIESVPDIQKIIVTLEGLKRVFSVGTIPEIQPLIQRANEKYLYWDDVKYRIPSGVNLKAEEVWAYIKFGRDAQRKPAPFADKNDRPFTYLIPDSLYRAISTVDVWSGGLITTDQPVGMPARERYIISSLMDEAIASSQLEGASTEYRIAKEMLRSGRKAVGKHEQMILNNWHAMQYIRKHRNEALSLENILELHSILTQNTLDNPEEAGKLRTRDDIVVEYMGEVVHEPPTSKDIPKRIRAFCEFANRDDEEKWIHPVIKGAMIHFWFAYDHPFIDGNGRTARALMYWYLLRRGYVLFEYLSISKHFLRAPGQYVRAYLYTETDNNDLTYFLVYNLRAIRFALQDVRKYIEHKQKEIARANDLLRSFRGLNSRQKSLVYHAIQHPDNLYTIEAHRNSHGIGYETARKDMLGLVAKGLLKQEREGKRLYVFIPSEKMMEKLRSETK